MSHRKTLMDILVRLGFADRAVLDSLQERLTQATKEEKWANQLIAHGVITRSQLDQAMQMMTDLECGSSEKRGAASADLATRHAGTVVRLADRIADKAAKVVRSSEERRAETGQDFPAVLAPLAEDV